MPNADRLILLLKSLFYRLQAGKGGYGLLMQGRRRLIADPNPNGSSKFCLQHSMALGWRYRSYEGIFVKEQTSPISPIAQH